MIYSRKTFKVPVYASKVTVMVVDDCMKEYNKIQKTIPNLPSEDTRDLNVLALAFGFDQKIGSYWILINPRKPIGPAIIAHECFHLALLICEHFGVETTSTSEAAAYLFEHLFTEVAQYLLGPLDDKDFKLQLRVRQPRRASRKDGKLGTAPNELSGLGEEPPLEISS